MNQIVGFNKAEEHNVPKFEIGARHCEVTESGQANIWRYCKYQAAKTIGLLYGIDENFEVSATAVVKTELHPLVGVPHRTTSDNATGFTYKYGWIQTAGNFDRVEAAAASADNAQAYTTSTAGKIDDGDDSGAVIQGLKFTAAAGSATNTTAFSANELKVVAA